MDSDAKSIFEKLIQAHRASDREAMSMVAVASAAQNQTDMRRERLRQEAQADALVKAKYAACGREDLYQPPSESEDGQMKAPTLINCTFNGNEAIEELTQMFSDVSVSENNQQQPEPKQPEPTPSKPQSYLAKILGRIAPILAGAVIAGGGVYLANKLQSPDKTTMGYDFRALPYEPSPFEGTTENGM